MIMIFRFAATQLVMALRLVINADDLGYSEERDLGIFQCFLRGRSISSTSVLANGATAASALSYAVQVGRHYIGPRPSLFCSPTVVVRPIRARICHWSNDMVYWSL